MQETGTDTSPTLKRPWINVMSNSDECDQADEELASVTSGPVSAHTRSKCSGVTRSGGCGGKVGHVTDDDSTIYYGFHVLIILQPFYIYLFDCHKSQV